MSQALMPAGLYGAAPPDRSSDAGSTPLPLEVQAAAQAVVFLEAAHLDAQCWDAWLALYAEDARFWLPAWTDEHTLSASPDRELSLLYCAARAGLEDRVWRVRSGLSVASTPLPRTCHMVAGCVATAAGADAGLVRVGSAWSCHVYDVKRRSQNVFFGRYEHLLRQDGGAWRIAAKTIVLMNDVVPTMLDFYCV